MSCTAPSIKNKTKTCAEITQRGHAMTVSNIPEGYVQLDVNRPVLWNPNQHPHLAVVGDRGSGKSITAAHMAAGFLAAMKQGTTVVVLTRDPAPYSFLRDNPAVQIVTQDNELVEVFAQIHRELDRRLDLLETSVRGSSATLLVIADGQDLSREVTRGLLSLIDYGASVDMHLIRAHEGDPDYAFYTFAGQGYGLSAQILLRNTNQTTIEMTKVSEVGVPGIGQRGPGDPAASVLPMLPHGEAVLITRGDSKGTRFQIGLKP
jgi:hypothetical protein